MAAKAEVDYKEMDDEELIKLIHKQDKTAQKTLIKRYQYLVYQKSNSYYLPGGDKSDVVQEGMIGLYKAIKDYKLEGNSSFKSFAGICIVRNIITAVKRANRDKRKPLNSSVSLNKPIYDSDSDRNLLDIIEDTSITNNPGEIYLNKKKLDLLKTKIKEISTELEYSVYQEYKKDKSYQKIAEDLGVHTKSVDNALQRFRKKMQKLLEEHEYFYFNE